MRPFDDERVRRIFDAYPDEVRRPLLQIREWIFESARERPEVGAIDETLKWGEPSYVTAETGSGSTLRLDRFDEERVAMFFHCRTMLVERFRSTLGDELDYSKNRAVLLDVGRPLPEEAVRTCIGMALTYHSDERRSRADR